MQQQKTFKLVFVASTPTRALPKSNDKHTVATPNFNKKSLGTREKSSAPQETLQRATFRNPFEEKSRKIISLFATSQCCESLYARIVAGDVTVAALLGSRIDFFDFYADIRA